MTRLLSLCLMFASAAVANGFDSRPVHTCSIVARDPATGEMGGAVQSHWFSVGKAVTLFISNGDILEITSRVESAFIDGREIDLNDKQKMLYEKYPTRYRQSGLIE